MDVARMHRNKAPTTFEYADIQQDARKWGRQRYKEGYRGAWLAQRIWGDMKDEYGRIWRKHYAEQEERDKQLQGAPPVRATTYEDPDQSVTLDVHAALDLLPDTQRHAIIECDMNGRRQDVVAREMNITTTGLKNALTLGRQSLRESLKAYS